MIESIDILVPQEIANDSSVRVLSLCVQEGCKVDQGQRIAEVETSKSTVDVTATSAGWIEWLCKEQDDVAVGVAFARIHNLPDWQVPVFSAGVGAEGVTNYGADEVIFSKKARDRMHHLGLSFYPVQGQCFVREQDVVAASKVVHLNSRHANETKVSRSGGNGSEAFVQHLCEGWKWTRLLRSDLLRINGRSDWRELFTQWWNNPGFVYIIWFRIAQAAKTHFLWKWVVYPFAKWRLMSCHFRTGIRIPLSVKAGPGLVIGHWGAIWINARCSLGANCTLGNDINMGSAGGAQADGVPQVGNNVYIGPGARLAGGIHIGQEVAIMANTLVTGSVAPGSIVLGVPSQVTGQQDTNRFVSNRCEFTY